MCRRTRQLLVNTKVKSTLLLYVVVGQSTSIFQLLSSKDQSLLIRRNAFLVLDLGFNIIDSIGGLNLQSDGLASECLDKDLHSAAETEDYTKVNKTKGHRDYTSHSPR
jgi:hypothetical protein